MPRLTQRHHEQVRGADLRLPQPPARSAAADVSGLRTLGAPRSCAGTAQQRQVAAPAGLQRSARHLVEFNAGDRLLGYISALNDASGGKIN
jgi:hypothetical protein